MTKELLQQVALQNHMLQIRELSWMVKQERGPNGMELSLVMAKSSPSSLKASWFLKLERLQDTGPISQLSISRSKEPAYSNPKSNQMWLSHKPTPKARKSTIQAWWPHKGTRCLVIGAWILATKTEILVSKNTENSEYLIENIFYFSNWILINNKIEIKTNLFKFL